MYYLTVLAISSHYSIFIILKSVFSKQNTIISRYSYVILKSVSSRLLIKSIKRIKILEEYFFIIELFILDLYFKDLSELI